VRLEFNRYPDRVARSAHIPRDILLAFYKDVYRRLRPLVGPDVALVFHDQFELEAWNELLPTERLYVAQAIYKAIAEMVSTKDEHSLRSEADQWLVDMYEQTGAKSYDARLCGQKVGTFSVKVAKAVAGKTVPTTDVKDWEGFEAWLFDEGIETLKEFAIEHATEIAERWVDATGEMPEWATTTMVDVPGKPERVTGTTLRIDPQKVVDAMRGELGGAITHLLEGDADA
jgi:hypothetical protein